MKKTAFFSGALLGATGVILGALGAHALQKVLNPQQLASFETAVRYQMYHAFLLIVLGLIGELRPHKLLHIAMRLTIAGVLCFSGSIYVLLFTGIGGLFGLVTPLGGLLMIAAWAIIAFWAVARYEK